jgi:hypothetical protein
MWVCGCGGYTNPETALAAYGNVASEAQYGRLLNAFLNLGLVTREDKSHVGGPVLLKLDALPTFHDIREARRRRYGVVKLWDGVEISHNED